LIWIQACSGWRPVVPEGEYAIPYALVRFSNLNHLPNYS
jgi:hypothetical protein